MGVLLNQFVIYQLDFTLDTVMGSAMALFLVFGNLSCPTLALPQIPKSQTKAGALAEALGTFEQRRGGLA